MRQKDSSIWQIWIDTGGTFTDCLARDPSGQLRRAKVLSSSALRGKIERPIDSKRLLIEEKWSAPADLIRGFEFKLLETSQEGFRVTGYDPDAHSLTLNKPLSVAIPPGAAFEVCSDEEAPILAARLVTQTPSDQPLPQLSMRLATTRGTNALLERKGVSMALFITRGFGDLLEIGTQQRPNLFALDVRKPHPLYEAVVEVEERATADGAILRPLKLEELRGAVEALLKTGIRVAAIGLMHSYLSPAHEHKLSKYLKKLGFKHVSLSSELAPFIKLLPRAETAVVDAYLAPVIGSYLARVQAAIPDAKLHVMSSAGGLISAQEFHAKDSLLSGPAGGVVGAALAGQRSGFNQIIAFDMGGTSTDVARFDSDFEYVFEHQVGDARLVAPALAIETVAAGGGSICAYDGYRLRVGPESAAADPGPACYGAGGPLTLTDINLLLGYLDACRFAIPISPKHARSRFEKIADAVYKQTGDRAEKDVLLQGFLDIANERMADAIRRVSVRKGYDPQEYALVAFGGAGGQHACGVAKRLNIKTIIIPPDAALLSAYGLGHAVLERFSEKQILQTINALDSKLHRVLKELTVEAQKAVAAEGVPVNKIRIRRRIVNLRFTGQDSVLSVEYDEHMPLHEAFESKYKEIFGHLPEGRDIEIESVRVVCSSLPEDDGLGLEEFPSRFSAQHDGKTHVCFDGEWTEVPFYERSELSAGAQIRGPALIFEPHSTTVIESGWTAEIDTVGALVLSHDISY